MIHIFLKIWAAHIQSNTLKNEFDLKKALAKLDARYPGGLINSSGRLNKPCPVRIVKR